ncbi:MAG: hypothetical protein V4850_29850 [Myxococcota bacterium]
MPNPSYTDPGTYNLRDLDTGLLVAKVHVEMSAADVAGGRGFIVHWAILKSASGGWGAWVKATQQVPKSFKWEGTGETLQQFLGWMHAPERKDNIRYMFQGTREVENIP